MISDSNSAPVADPGQPDALVAQLLSRLGAERKYLSARLVRGKEWVIVYYVHHPKTGKWTRKREKLNRIRDRAERLRYGLRRVRELNVALALGWTPFDHRGRAIVAVKLMQGLTDFFDAKVREKIRPDSQRSYKSCINIMQRWLVTSNLAELDVIAFTEQHARSFMGHSYTERELSARAFNNYHTFYVTVWNWLKEHGYCNANVFTGIKKKRLDPEASGRRPPTQDERGRIRRYLEERNPRFFAFCLLCFHCGIRPKEAFMLRPEHFHVESNHILIPGSVAKNHRTQGVAIPAVLQPHLEALRIEDQRPDQYVFSKGFRPGKQLCSSRDSGRAWDNMRKAIGLPVAVTFYQLKHAGGEQLSRDGVSEVDLMNHLRHHDLSETSTYTRRSYKQGVRDVLDKASPF
ncbi:MAG: tyrosine-type recombinase/integrase [Bacteroidetes bacterium]|nr:tyrosine-type recombinase/integrase [Bacteroidota bacterium]